VRRALAPLDHPLHLGDLRGAERTRPPDGLAPPALRRERGLRAFGDQFALEVRKRGEEVQHKPPGRAGGVDRLGEGAEADAARGELVHRRDEMRHRTAQPIEPGDDERIAGPERVETCREAVAIGGRAGEDVLEDLRASGGMQRVTLLLGALLRGRDASVTEEARLQIRHVGSGNGGRAFWDGLTRHGNPLRARVRDSVRNQSVVRR